MGNNNSLKGIPNKDIEINIIEIFSRLWDSRKKIFLFSCLGAFIGLIVGLSIPKQYTVSVTFAPEINSNNRRSGLASMAASFLGGSVSQSEPNALNVLLASEIVSSTPFLMEMLDARVISESAQIDTTFSEYLNMERSPWWNMVLSLPRIALNSVRSLFVEEEHVHVTNSGEERKNNIIALSKKDVDKVNNIRNRFLISINKKTSLITLSATYQNPEITAIVVDSVLSKLQRYITHYKVMKATEDFQYWTKLVEEAKANYYDKQQKYAQYVDDHSNVVLQSVLVERERLQNDMNLAFQAYSQVVQQLQMSQVKVQEAKPAFTIIEPAVIPSIPISLGKITCMIIFAVLAVAFYLIWEIPGKYLLKKIYPNKY